MMDIILLADFSVLKPDPGLIFWTSIIFLTLWTFLGRKAFGPIQKALKEREKSIADALDSAKNAREEMANLQAENQNLLDEARKERASILQEAKDVKTRILSEAEAEAKTKASKIVTDAQAQIETEKQSALIEVKAQVGTMAVEIAEKIIRKELSKDGAQAELAKSLVKEMSI